VIVTNQRIHWEQSGELAGEPYDSLLPDPAPRRSIKSCEAALLGLELAIMQERSADARYFSEYLLERNYREPGLLRLCSDYSVCEQR
jgi:hypothetical protein